MTKTMVITNIILAVYIIQRKNGDFFCSQNTWSPSVYNATIYKKEGTAKGVCTRINRNAGGRDVKVVFCRLEAKLPYEVIA
jgi:hypothetical protein